MLDAASMSDRITTRPVAPTDIPVITALHAAVFGPGRFARSAYRVREAMPADSPKFSRFCRAAFLGHRLIAAVRFSGIEIGGEGGALLLGPIVVDTDFSGQGHGRRLIGEGLDEAKAAGVKLVILVGDEPYYGRFGFKPVPPGQIAFPAPVNPARILAAELEEGALASYRGVVGAVQASEV